MGDKPTSVEFWNEVDIAKVKNMKTNPEDYAFPFSDDGFIESGLTKREEFSKEMMKALVSDYETVKFYIQGKNDGMKKMARDAVRFADALIEVLNEEDGN